MYLSDSEIGLDVPAPWCLFSIAPSNNSVRSICGRPKEVVVVEKDGQLLSANVMTL